MTAEEAIKYIDNVVIDEKFGIDSMVKASAILNTCKDALKKQIPVKPTIYENKYSDDKAAHCPKCEANGHYGLIDYTRVVNEKSIGNLENLNFARAVVRQLIGKGWSDGISAHRLKC